MRLPKKDEIELNKVSNETTKKGKSLALNSTQKRNQSAKAMKALEESEEDEEDSFKDDDDDDEIVHLARKISKAWIKRKKKSFILKKDKKDKTKQDEIICFECKEPGHVRFECPRLKKTSRKKTTKKKAMMATQEDLDEEQENVESQDEEEIVANLYFIADIVSKKKTEVSDSELELASESL